MSPPLAIIQARLGSTRLPGKMLLSFGPETLLARVHRLTVEAFGWVNTIVATPAADMDALKAAALNASLWTWFGWDGPEWDVLGRFYACAHFYRWHPDTVIVRVTPDDPFKDAAMMRRVAAGERLPVEQGGEAFTLAMLDVAHVRFRFGRERHENVEREHITDALFPSRLPLMEGEGWTVDTQADYEAALRRLALMEHEAIDLRGPA